METALAAAVGIYMFFRVRRLLRFYGADVGRAAVLVVNLSIAAGLGALCLDVWTTGAMVVLHIAGLFLAADGIALSVRWMRRFLFRSTGRVYGFCRKMYGCGALPILAAVVIFLYGYHNMNHIGQTVYQVRTDKQVGAYRVVLLTDIHYGTVQDSDILQEALAEIDGLHPDIIVLGGDLVDEGTSGEKMREGFRVLGSLESRYGIYYVYGNHDRQPYTADRTYTYEELEQAIESEGIRILRDEYIEIGDDLILAGREDAIIARYLTGRSSTEELLRGADRDRYIILADHEPVEPEENDAQGVDLMLSGHTHAGQIWPVGLLNALGGTLNYGEYQVGDCKVIVSSGAAGWGYPIRTGGHCEYVVVDIAGRADEGPSGKGG